ncbi:cytochrome c-type biogenesis protein [Photobacterium chitinilyticum]|uniref:Cytochrome c-type biogenesis protein n=1 Tax=Photobacterium chitinilyticum TaxID=2485123 RepID=A0A444JU23_9GAMM|nr:cytochrome c-type biogenesis protein [Photobacterium chitinilyticum]RWX56580.1 cytochrome c-type biogenesis protein CcmH [Photobacterium chitinilyticum]
MIKRITAILLGLSLVLAAALPVSAAIDVYEFKTLEQEQAFHNLTATLRCPKCQNNTIADSNAELAKDMRQKAFDLLSEGKSEQDVVDYMIARYGNFVTYDPPLMLSTIILWAGPLLFVLIGFTVLVMRSRKNGEKQTTVKLKADEEQRLKSLLEEMEQQPNNNGKVK